MSAVLPPAAWREGPGVARVVAALGADGAFVAFVGGAVRDTLAGLPVTDIDVATALPPEVAAARLAAADIKVVPTGLAHGTVTAVASGTVIEVTTLRRDVATDGRRATVAFSTDWREDAARRDFTINALYADPATGRVADAFGGLADLAAHKVRFIGDAATRIAEDHLRILRFYRFAARFHTGPLDADGRAACVAARATLRALSRERVAMELKRLLALPDPAPIVAVMADDGVLAEILPEAGRDAPADLARLVAAEALADASGADAPLRRLAALLPTDPRAVAGVAARLRLSKAEARRLTAARAADPALPADPRALAYRLGIAGARDRLLLAGADSAALADWTVPTLPITGGDLIALGLTPGPGVAARLREVEAAWIEAGFPDRAATLALARTEVAGGA